MSRRQSGLGVNTDNDNAAEENIDGDDMRIRKPIYHNMMMMCKTEGHRCRQGICPKFYTAGFSG